MPLFIYFIPFFFLRQTDEMWCFFICVSNVVILCVCVRVRAWPPPSTAMHVNIRGAKVLID